MADAATVALVALVAAGVALTLAGERREEMRLQWAGKPAASAAFVALGLLHGAPSAILAALALSAVGDVLLVPRATAAFRAGVVAFLLAHVAYLVAFTQVGLSWPWLAAAALVFAALALVLARRILPGVGRALRPAVVPYIVVVTAMAATAVGTRMWALVVPALLFYANDVALAHHRFVRPDWRSRLFGLPLYYAGQVLFALA